MGRTSAFFTFRVGLEGSRVSVLTAHRRVGCNASDQFGQLRDCQGDRGFAGSSQPLGSGVAQPVTKIGSGSRNELGGFCSVRFGPQSFRADPQRFDFGGSTDLDPSNDGSLKPLSEPRGFRTDDSQLLYGP